MAAVDLVIKEDSRFRRVTEGDAVSQLRPAHVHVQAVPNSVWHVQHNLGTKLLSVKTFLSSGEEIAGDPDWPAATVNQIDINFSGSLSGQAVVRSL
jgi:hypothetical protein